MAEVVLAERARHAQARAALALAALLHALPAAAQTRPRVDVILPPAASRGVEGPRVASTRLLTAGREDDLLRNGFPARVHYKLERWRVRRWLDDLRATREWDAIVRFDPLSHRYRVFRVRGRDVTAIGDFITLAAADSAVGEPVQSAIPPPRAGERSYYALRVDVEMLSVTDLDELERWLRGELRPAVRGEQNPGTAVERGLRTVLVRVLGGEKRRYLARSPTFRP